LLLGRKGRYKTKALSVRAIQKPLERYRSRVGLSMHCHQLRHTFATDLLMAGADLVVVQDLLGHRQVQTTENYCRVANEKVRADYFQAMEKIRSWSMISSQQGRSLIVRIASKIATHSG
jgi:site-specific recombinase XerD